MWLLWVSIHSNNWASLVTCNCLLNCTIAVFRTCYCFQKFLTSAVKLFLICFSAGLGWMLGQDVKKRKIGSNGKWTEWLNIHVMLDLGAEFISCQRHTASHSLTGTCCSSFQVISILFKPPIGSFTQNLVRPRSMVTNGPEKNELFVTETMPLKCHIPAADLHEIWTHYMNWCGHPILSEFFSLRGHFLPKRTWCVEVCVVCWQRTTSSARTKLHTPQAEVQGELVLFVANYTNSNNWPNFTTARLKRLTLLAILA